MAERPDRGGLHRQAAADDQDRHVNRRDGVQPDRGGRDTEGKACGARRDAADEAAGPQHRERRRRERGEYLKPH
jgi:hypothetical protein